MTKCCFLGLDRYLTSKKLLYFMWLFVCLVFLFGFKRAFPLSSCIISWTKIVV